MSLAAAILEIAEEMEKTPETLAYAKMDFYAKMLRMAVKAAEGSQPVAPVMPMMPFASNPLEAQFGHRMAIEQAKDEFRNKKKEMQVEAEQDGEVFQEMVQLIGGKENGTLFPLSGAVPKGAFIPVGDEVYKLGKDGKLWFDEVQTKRMQAEKGGTTGGIVLG